VRPSDAAPPANGAIPTRVLGWSLSAVLGLAVVVVPLYDRIGAQAEHAKEVLALRDRVHEAVQAELRALVRGQDEVLQREMRLLVDALRAKIDHVEAIAATDREWIRDRFEKMIAELGRVRDGVFKEQR